MKLDSAITKARLALQQFGDDGMCIPEDITPVEYKSFRVIKLHVKNRMNEWGRGLSLNEALIGALMERVERLSAARHNSAILYSYDDIKAKSVIPLEDLGLNNHQVLTNISNENIEYVKVHSFSGDKDAYAPASRVLLRYRSPFVDHSCSTGLASHFKENEAAERAIIEVIERHFHHLTKFNNVEFQRLTIDEGLLSPRFNSLLKDLANSNLLLRIWSCPKLAEPMHCIWIELIQDDNDHKLYNFGALYHFSLHWDVEVAIERAVTEALVSRSAHAGKRSVIISEPAYEKEFKERLNLSIAGIPISQLKGESVTDRSRALESISTTAGGNGIYIYDLTHPDINIPVIRAIIPGLQANFDLMGLPPTHPRTRVSKHLAIYDDVMKSICQGKLSNQALFDERNPTTMSLKFNGSEKQKLLSRYNGKKTPLVSADNSYLSDLICNRQTVREVGGIINLKDLSEILLVAHGKAKLKYASKQGFTIRNHVPSGGSLHPIDVFVQINDSDDIPPGLYYFDSFSSDLTLLETLQKKPNKKGTLNPAITIWLAYIPARSEWKYKAKSYSLALLEAGHIGQNIILIAQQLGINVVPLGRTTGSLCEKYLNENEQIIYSFAIGRKI